jgi:hypothetical protein
MSDRRAYEPRSGEPSPGAPSPFPGTGFALPLPTSDYGESWVLHAACSCGMTWNAMAGRRAKDRRLKPIEADVQLHVRREHAALVSSTRFQWYNARRIAAHVANALIAALDRIS